MATREGELFVERVEVNLDGRQIFCLFCGGAVIASLVFVLGVAVGRRVEARERPGTAATTGASSDPLAALDQLAAAGAAAGPDQDLTFASTLRGEGAGAVGEVDRTIESAARAGATGEDPAGAGKPAEPAAMLPARPLVASGSEAAAEAARAKAEAAKAEAAKAEAAKAEAAKAEAAAAPSAEPRFTLHLLSFEQRAEADALVGRLRKAGYQPYVVETPEEGKGTMFRVRVGQFGSFDEAVAGKADFEKKQNIIAYVTRTRK